MRRIQNVYILVAKHYLIEISFPFYFINSARVYLSVGSKLLETFEVGVGKRKFLKADNYDNGDNDGGYDYIVCWGFMLYQVYFSFLTATVHKSMFPGLFLTSTLPVHYPDTLAGQ